MEIDDSFYNRQRYVLGDSGMKLMSEAAVYIFGMKGLGIEIAKNLVLGGFREIFLDDCDLCAREDCGAQFYVTEDDVTMLRTRAQASAHRLSQLNPYVRVTIPALSLAGLIDPMRNEANQNILRQLDGVHCVVLTGASLQQIGIMDNYCRHRGDVRLVVADCIGLLGVLFCDFGVSFSVDGDSDEEMVEFFVSWIDNGRDALVRTISENDGHGLKIGDVVSFKDVDGMEEINGLNCVEVVSVLSKSEFRIALDTTGFGRYVKNGICVQKKRMKTFQFENFFDQCIKPTIINFDYCSSSSQHLHLLYLSLKKFYTVHHHYPTDNQHFTEIQLSVESLSRTIGFQMENQYWNTIQSLCRSSSGCLPPLCALFGGIAAQEVMKAVTHQFVPIQQWLLIEYECLSSSSTTATVNDSSVTIKPRYENIRKCIGYSLLEKLQNLRLFMVGCGAIGCELLKNMAMIGISADMTVDSGDRHQKQVNNCGNFEGGRIQSSGDSSTTFMNDADDEFSESQITVPEQAHGIDNSSTSAVTANIQETIRQQSHPSTHRPPKTTGRIFITDNDLIEKSNLNRQFLFKEHHIKQPKSVVARLTVMDMNPDINVDAHQNMVCPATEHIYNDSFFHNLDLCLNALDNIEGRRYMDNRCIINEKALIESGTMSTKGHVQVIMPHLTENYANLSDPIDTEIPYCTLKSFPAKIEHCVEWAREKFMDNFFLKPSAVLRYLGQVGHHHSTDLSSGEYSYEDVITAVKVIRKRPASYRDCIHFVRVKFEKYFHHKALQLLHSFPADTVLADGSMFWQFPKRQPVPVSFDDSDPLHKSFIRCYSEIMSTALGISRPTEMKEEDLDAWIFETNVPTFVPSNKPIETDESVKRQDKKESDLKIDEIDLNDATSEHDSALNTDVVVHPVEFDKDNTLHVNFIAALANLRGRMYGIDEVDVPTVKRISGRIIPAIATTTSVIAGLATIELLKIVKGIPSFLRNSFINLSTSDFIMSEPGSCNMEKIINVRDELITFSLWDHWTVYGCAEFTVKDFIADLERQKGLLCNMILHGNRIVYMNILPGSTNKLTLKLNTLLLLSDGDRYADLLVSYSNPDPDKNNGVEDIKGPRIRYWLNGKVPTDD